ncbi:MAG TPA: hypothetical protein VI160_08270 [Gemmatimonadales bacterium]
MALTPRRWIAIALFGAAALAVASLPPSAAWWDSARGSGAALYRASDAQVQIVNRALASTSDAIRLLARRDTLVRLVNALHPRAGATPVVGFEGIWSGPQRARLRQMVADAWQTLGATAPEVPVAIVFRNQVNRGAGFMASGNWYLLPGATGGPCIVAARPTGTATTWPVGGVRSILGPCAFYGVFGHPGAAVEQWLLRGRFWQAADADWLSPPAPAQVFEVGDLIPGDASATYLFEAISAMAYQGLGLGGAACAQGDLVVCRRLVLSSDEAGDRFGHMTVGHISIVRMPNAYYDQGFDRWFLSDLVRNRGRENFARFWRAPQAPDSAFAAVYGMPIEAWTREWLRERRPGLHAGPGIRTASVVWGLVSIVGFVAIGAALAQRRRIL